MYSMEYGDRKIKTRYDAKTDLLYFRVDDREQQVINKRLSEDIMIDIGEDSKIVGIEILDASKHLNLEKLLPVDYEVIPAAPTHTGTPS